MNEKMLLIPLSEAPEYELNERLPDLRGWNAEAADGEVVGRVRDLIVDRAAGRVRYLELELSPAFAARAGHRVLVPVGLASADASDDVVRVLTVTSGAVRSLEAYTGGAVTRGYEIQLRRSVLGALELPAELAEEELAREAARDAGTDLSADSADTFYNHEHFDERRMLASRRADDEDKDFSYLLGVGGAMTEHDVNPEIVGELGAGEMHIPVVREETRRSVAPEDA